MEKDIRTSVKYVDTSKDIWDDLEERFGKESAPTAYELKQLNSFKQKEKLYEFLMGLDNEYSKIKTQILAMKPTPSLGTVYHLVAEDEQQRAVSVSKQTNTEAATFQTYTPGRKEITTDFNCQKKKSAPKDIKRAIGEEVEHCNHCGKNGHNTDRCFKRIGYPDWWPNKAK
ncbi:uncharacterized protein LOC111908914 [Lactuca sativa]|uniref:uncharacterized protein LOC111908914 n=1 Tax=Lactuca sativa TaxID=4236 RepID=UPI000CD9DF37|nr:uncharacterized protein LOC111908914 [Lactuca sativa]